MRLQCLPKRHTEVSISTATKKTKPTDADKLAAARQFTIEAARLSQQLHCQRVVILDVSGISPITDFLLIATGSSARQMRSICDQIEELGRPMGFRPLTASGAEGETWIVQDFIDVVVHVFSEEARLFYDLDGLWGDAKTVDWQTEKK